MSQKRALILGINGQDGSYLAEILLAAGYEVHGVVRRNSQPNLWRLNGCIDQLILHQGDLLDPQCLDRLIGRVRPTEIYNEADQDHVGFSTAAPKVSVDVTYGGVACLLEMVRGSSIRLFQPLSATMFGNAPAPQSLETPFDPQSPYAVSKVAAYYLCKHYREKHGVFVSTAILYNHDSVRRQGDYLLHKICRAAERISRKEQEYLMLSNPEMRVDIGCAEEYMQGVHKLMQLDVPQNIVIGTGVGVKILDLVIEAFRVSIVSSFESHFKETQGSFTGSLIAEMSHTSEVLNWLPKRSVYAVIRDLCHHYSTELYGGK